MHVSKKLLLFVTWLSCILGVASGISSGAPLLLICFGAWSGGVVWTLLVQELLWS